MSNNAIIIDNISMRFNLSKEKVDNAKEYAIKRIRKQIRFDEFYALRNVSFNVEKGDAFAIIGENGCGKSTLLKAISGIYYPSQGEVKVEGTISPLIELGAGFDMDMTARENIFLNGAVLGHSKPFMQEHFDEIINFAELHEFVDVPLKNYSSGMVARLGFAIATVTTPDILIVDEILAVGDMNFQQKCEKKMSEMLSGGTTLLFVSHDINQVKKLCKHAVWLNKGIVQMVGDVETVAEAYVKDMTENGGNGIVHFEDTQTQEPLESKKKALEQEEAPTKYTFVILLHVLAALMIMYQNVFETLFTSLGIGNRIIAFIHNHIIVPFSIDLGYLGVVILFVIAGFLNTDSVLTSSTKCYLWKKTKKIFSPLFISVASLYIIQLIVGTSTGTPTYWAQFTLWEWLQSATLIGHFTGISEQIIGVTWFLIPLVVYYVMSAILKPLLKESPKISMLSMTIFVVIFTFAFSYLGGLWFTFANYIQHIPLILLGQTIFLTYNKQISKKSGALIFALNFIILTQNIRLFFPQNYYYSPTKISSIIIGAVIFTILFIINQHLKSNSAINWMNNKCYILYLTHYQIAQLTVPLLLTLNALSSSMIAFMCLIIIFLIVIIEHLIISLLSKLIKAIKRKLIE